MTQTHGIRWYHHSTPCYLESNISFPKSRCHADLLALISLFAAMDARWACLQPWLEALQAVLVRPGETSPRQEEQRSVCTTFSCWQSMSQADAVGTLAVEFPVDQASRQAVERQQQIREVVTIFDTLAAVDNAAFVGALSEYMCLRHVQEGPRGAVWPAWRFSLGGLLSADDAVTRAPSVTWGELLFGSDRGETFARILCRYEETARSPFGQSPEPQCLDRVGDPD
jgi:hypothetical protein